MTLVRRPNGVVLGLNLVAAAAASPLALQACSDPVTIAETELVDGGADAPDAAIDAPPATPEASPCEGAAECAPGQTRVVPCGLCGKRTETCSTSCRFGGGTCESQGACEPGSTESRTSDCAVGTKERACSATCGWDAWSGCGVRGGVRPIAPYPSTPPEVPVNCSWVGDAAACRFVSGIGFDFRIGIYFPATNVWELSPKFNVGGYTELVAAGNRVVVTTGLGVSVPRAWVYDRTTQVLDGPYASGLTSRDIPIVKYIPADDAIVVVGGRPNGQPPNASDGATFNVGSKTWTPVYATTSLGSAIPSSGATVFGGKVLVPIIHQDGVTPNDLGTYDPTTKAWTVTALPAQDPITDAWDLIGPFGANGLALFGDTSDGVGVHVFDLGSKKLSPLLPPASMAFPPSVTFSPDNHATGFLVAAGPSIVYGLTVNTGFRLDTTTQTWTKFDAPTPYKFAFSDSTTRHFVWTGTEFLFFGGDLSSTFIYRP